jgi:hypothetical protein
MTFIRLKVLPWLDRKTQRPIYSINFKQASRKSSCVTLTIGKVITLSLTGTRSQKMPNMPRFPDMCRC